MTEKVKLTQSQADAIGFLKNKWGDASIIESHARRPIGWMQLESNALNELPLLTLVDALRIGYEVESEYEKDDWVQDHHGNIGVVTRIEGDKVWGYWNGDKHEAHALRKEIVKKFTPEEIKAEKESRVWAVIGRKPYEVKDDDVMILVEGRRESLLKVKSFDSRELHEMMRSGDIIGFYPAESFVSFEEGEEE